MKQALCIILLYMQPLISTSQAAKASAPLLTETTESKEIIQGLNGYQLADYDREAIRITKAFGKYVTYITNMELSKEIRTEAALLALDLFINEDAIIQDHSFSLGTFTIKAYLTNLLHDNLELNIKLKDVASKSNFSQTTGSKLLDIEQIVELYNNQNVKEVQYLNREVKSFLQYKNKYIYHNKTPFVQVKLGGIKHGN